jgi:hypothetical protein
MSRQRVIRIGLEIDGQLRWYDGLRIKATGTKFAGDIQAEASVTISGLTIETRNLLLTETSPFNYYQTPRKIYIDAGREGGAVFRIFEGDIVSSEPGGAPDLDVTLKAQTVHAYAQQAITTAYGSRVELQSIAADVAESMGLALRYEADSKLISRYSYMGNKRDQVRALAQSGGVSVFVDGGDLVVKNRDSYRAGEMRILTANSGMVGLPQPTAVGCDATFTIDGVALIGGALEIKSEYYQAANGVYLIEQLKFDIETHGDRFFYSATCRRLPQ